MRAIPILLMAVLGAAPASAQDVRWYAGPTLGWINTHQEPRLGLNAGVSFRGFEEPPNFRVDLSFTLR